MGVAEDLAVNALELVTTAQAGQMVSQLPVGQFGSLVGEHEPPGGGTDGSSADVEANSHVTKLNYSQVRTVLRISAFW